jgi:hypothetical protein
MLTSITALRKFRTAAMERQVSVLNHESGKKSKGRDAWIVAVCNMKTRAVAELVAVARGCSKYVSRNYIVYGLNWIDTNML